MGKNRLKCHRKTGENRLKCHRNKTGSGIVAETPQRSEEFEQELGLRAARETPENCSFINLSQPLPSAVSIHETLCRDWNSQAFHFLCPA